MYKRYGKDKKKNWTNVNYYLMIYNELFSPGRLQWLHEKLHDRRLCQGINQETLIYVQYNLKTNVQYSKCGIQEPSMHHHVPDSKNTTVIILLLFILQCFLLNQLDLYLATNTTLNSTDQMPVCQRNSSIFRQTQSHGMSFDSFVAWIVYYLVKRWYHCLS